MPVVAERRERERQKRREAILKVASRLFADRPYDAVRMDDIAEATELAKGTLYLHFADKDAIVAELGERVLDELAAAMDKVTRDARRGWIGSEAGLYRVVDTWHDSYWAHPGLFHILVLDRPHLLAEFSAGADGRCPRILEPVETLIQIGQTTGEFSGAMEPGVVSYALWALFVGGLLLSGRGEIEESDLRATSLPVLHALVRGLCGDNPVG